jgi:hypothetical protein
LLLVVHLIHGEPQGTKHAAKGIRGLRLHIKVLSSSLILV